MMRINHNLAALTAADTLNNTNSSLQKSMQALSSGLRVNSASDDASGLAISEKMRSQIAGYDTAIKNTQDGISMLRTAEEALGDADSVLQRMRELAIQSSNDTLTDQDRKYIQTEIEQLKEQVNLISETTRFNKRNLLDGSAGALWSSGDPGLRAIINGEIKNVNTFQTDTNKSSGTNYRIEVRATSGRAQVQKSNILQGVYTGQYLEDTLKNDDGTEEKITIVTENEATLRDIANFYDSEGRYTLNEPQELTIVQGDGQMASVTLYGNDTITYAISKINDAIANSLGQGKYVDDASKFATLSDGTPLTSESVLSRQDLYDDKGNVTGYSVNASIIIRSAVAGRDGELFFTGDNALINALGLNTIQESSENTYKVSVYDAHTGHELAQDVKITGNRINGVISPDIDVEFDPMAGIQVTWNEGRKQFTLSDEAPYEANLHIAENGLIFQTGSNQDEKFTIQFGDMSTAALDIKRVNVMTRETAARSIGVIDNAIERIVKERTKIVSYESTLENTLANLATSSKNLTSSEGQIRDADMAKSTLRFMEFKILSQSQASVLVQANQQPESIINIMNS